MLMLMLMLSAAWFQVLLSLQPDTVHVMVCHCLGAGVLF